MPGLLIGLACALRRPDVSVADAAVALPLVSPSTDRRRPYVRVEVAGLPPGLFLIDTGYTFSACDDALVGGLDLTIVGQARLRGVLGRLTAQVASLPTLWIGPHRVDGLRCAVRDLGAASSIDDPPEVPVYGVLGMDLWSAFAVDMASERFVVRPSDGAAPFRLRGEARRGDRARVPVDFDGVRRWLVVDTGSDTTLLRGLPLPAEQVTVRLAGSGGGDGLRAARRWTVGASVAGTSFGTISPVSVDTPPVAGLDLLSRHRWTWDFPAGRFAVDPPHPEAAPADVHLGGP